MYICYNTIGTNQIKSGKGGCDEKNHIHSADEVNKAVEKACGHPNYRVGNNW